MKKNIHNTKNYNFKLKLKSKLGKRKKANIEILCRLFTYIY